MAKAGNNNTNRYLAGYLRPQVNVPPLEAKEQCNAVSKKKACLLKPNNSQTEKVPLQTDQIETVVIHFVFPVCIFIIHTHSNAFICQCHFRFAPDLITA